MEAPLAAAVLKAQLGNVVEDDALPRHLDAALGTGDDLANRLLRAALLARMAYALARVPVSTTRPVP